MATTPIDLYRQGNANSPRMDNVRSKDIATYELDGEVWVNGGLGGGVSTFAVPRGGKKLTMKLSYKATQFIIEAIDFQIEAYQKRLEEIEDTDDDEASDIGNDCGFLEALRNDLLETLKEGKLPQGRGNMPSEQELTKLIRELSINDRLLLVDAINESIREEISGVKTAISSV